MNAVHLRIYEHSVEGTLAPQYTVSADIDDVRREDLQSSGTYN